ncbi:MAG: fatty acid--CoA ligase family protein, partial [Paludibacter sp.]
FNSVRKSLRTVNFLLFDHWGGLNTMFHTLSNGGVVLTLKDRQPESICAFIEKHKIELLPASPTFLNLLLISESYKGYDLSSLKLISYGTEPMPMSTLERLKKTFPEIKLLQTYGLIELGVMRSKSKSDDSLWVKVGGEGYETRVVNDLLEIKAESAMLGYLNAASPFTEDGWFMTGDQVEVDGEYIKILGRKSEIINVGGEKVYPQEVESVIQELDNIAEVTVYGEKNPIMGNIVCAKVRLLKDEDAKEFTKRLKIYCKQKMQSFKVPVKVVIATEEQFGERYKKKRA